MSSPAPPPYDPAVHTVEAGDPTVSLELWCGCGLAHRQIDPVSRVLPQIDSFRARHTGSGHGPADPAAALAEREARREAGHRVLGIQDSYEPRVREDVPTSSFDWAATADGGE